MRVQKYLYLIFMSILLVSSISALTTYTVFGDGTKAKTLEDGAAVNFEADFFSMNPAMDLVIELRNSSDSLVYTLLNTKTGSKTYTGIYSLNKSVYSGIGSYTIIAKGTDSIGSSQFDQLSVNVLDTTLPSGAISYPSDSTTYSANITKLEFTTTDLNLVKCEYSTDNGVTKTAVACTSGILTTVALSSVEGTNKWIVYATDVSGNTYSTSVSFTIKSLIPVDNVSPLISILGPINNTIYAAKVSFLNFIATDSNLKKCEYSTDNGVTKTAVACTSGILTTVALSSVEGANKWIVYAEDNAGNRYSTYTSFIVNSSLTDIVSPTISVISPQKNKEYNTKKITLKLTTDEDAKVIFSLDNKANITMNNPYDHVFTYELSLSDNKHQIIFYAIDKAGNVASKKVEFVIDYKKDDNEDEDDEEDDEMKVIEVSSLTSKETITLGEIKSYYEGADDESKIIYLTSKTKSSFFEGVANFFKNIWETIVSFFKKIFGLK